LTVNETTETLENVWARLKDAKDELDDVEQLSNLRFDIIRLMFECDRLIEAESE
jgi:hypothetical protein